MKPIKMHTLADILSQPKPLTARKSLSPEEIAELQANGITVVQLPMQTMDPQDLRGMINLPKDGAGAKRVPEILKNRPKPPKLD